MSTRLEPVLDEEDLAECFRLFLAASNDLEAKLGEPSFAAEDVPWMPESLAHFHRSDPERMVFAVEDGTRAGFGACYQREDFWYLSYLYVLPEFQGAGIGRQLLEHLLPGPRERGTMTLATTVETRQPASTMLYATYGIVPREPMYWLVGLTDLERLPAIAELDDAVNGVDLVSAEHQVGIDALDRATLGYARPIDHALFASEAETARVYVRGDEVVAYAYLMPGWVCPANSASEEMTAAIVRDLATGHPETKAELVVPVWGSAGTLLSRLLNAGMRAEHGATLTYCSNGRVPPSGYLPYGGYLP